VVLTFLIKLALHRTTFKQHESMMKMQKLAPELKLLQEQYKSDKQKMAQKQMELWKKHGVNPLGGCLPILIQIPIFTALYLAFCHSADMRGHGFLWINDLTLPDQLIGWVVGGWTISINPLPIIYIGVSIWMSMMQKVPPGADPQQEQMMKMMRWLPVVFGVIFYNFPSGLVLYFTINAVLSTIEIKMVRKKLGMH
jgi:YidC/Oxa1 family membrane protein insertase